MTRIGILSDTHISSISPWFTKQVQIAFSDCSVILHAGDLTDISILSAFEGKKVHAVHGNMCDSSSYQSLPTDKLITIDKYTIGLCHGAGVRHTIEERMLNLFPNVNCIVYGHTHIAANHRFAQTLVINPGSFAATGRYGAPGSYAILTTHTEGLQCSLHQFSETDI